MAYGDTETSVDQATPLELLEFTYSVNIWRYTNNDKDVVFNGQTYRTIPYRRGVIEQSIVADKASLTITMPFDVDFSELFRVQPPSGIVTGKIIAFNSENMGDNYTLWQGRILSCEWKHPWCEFNCENLLSSLERGGLRRRYSPMCPFALYGTECKAISANVRRYVDVSALTDKGFVAYFSDSIPDYYFNGGYVEWQNALLNNPERRMIAAYNSTSGMFALVSPTVSLSVGQTVAVYPGCNHSIDDCTQKFQNSLNFGGMPYIPKKNPFGGAILY